VNDVFAFSFRTGLVPFLTKQIVERNLEESPPTAWRLSSRSYRHAPLDHCGVPAKRETIKESNNQQGPPDHCFFFFCKPHNSYMSDSPLRHD